MSIKIKKTCPFGSECEKVNGDSIERCEWLVKLSGIHPQSGKEIDESRCAVSWIPILQIEGNGSGQELIASIQSMRNETVKRQDIALGAIKNAKAIANR